MTTAGNKIGRPSKFKTINQEQLKKLCLAGFTDMQISDFFNINQDTLNEYKKKYPKFSESLKDWKIKADANVEKSLYHRAIGYKHDSEEIFMSAGQVVKVQTVKQYAPSEVACIFWLKNRQPDKWREKPLEVEDDSLKNQELRFDFVPTKLDEKYSRFLN